MMMSSSSGNHFSHRERNKTGPIVVGLTGSIGMGKSTITKQLRRLGFPVFDADEAVHDLYSPGGEAVEPIRQHYPSAVIEGSVNRKALMEVILKDSSALKVVESIVHPLVFSKRQEFYHRSVNSGSLMIFYDIPLLFENKQEDTVDYVIVVSADPDTQRNRVMNRPGMTEEKFQSILSKQVSDEVKRKRADYVILTNYEGYSEGRAQLTQTLEAIISKERLKYADWIKYNTDYFKIDEYNANDDEDYDCSSNKAIVTGLRSAIDAVLLDLDDTLVPTYGPVNAALEALLSYCRAKMPRTSEVLMSKMKEYMKR